MTRKVPPTITLEKPSSHKLSFVAILSVLVVWIAKGTETACYNTWIPLPLVGYFRYDVSLAILLLVELPLLYVWSSSAFASAGWVVLILLALGLPNLPDAIRPTIYLRPPALYVRLLSDEGYNPFGKTIQVFDHGLQQNDVDRFVRLAWDHKANWTHAYTAKPLGYFQFGASINIDFKWETAPPLYSLAFGVYPTLERLAREAVYRLHFPEEIEHVQQIIRSEMLPTLRPVYAKALNLPEQSIVFGDEFVPGLGLPSIAIMFSNVLWHWVLNPHVDRTYTTGFIEKTQGMNCTEHLDVRAFIMPLTVPPGAGVRYWESEQESRDIYYEMGKIYSFDASTVHAILPLPYFEWRRQEARMILQAFGVQCDDGRWILYH